MSAIGYREAVAVVQGRMTLDEAKTQMKRITRVFVRRQSNWFKEDDEQIKWFEATSPMEELEKYIKITLSTPGNFPKLCLSE
jgi:tRNA dimethylallyltransferase